MSSSESSAFPGPAGASALEAPPAFAPGHEVIIERQRGLLRFSWREFWEYRDLLLLLVRRDFLSKYKQTLLGPLWFILQPLISTAIYIVIFARVANIGTNGIPPALFYLCGLMPWNYFAQNVTVGAATFQNNSHLFGKVYFPRIILPASIVISNLMALLLQAVPCLFVWLWYRFFGSDQVHLELTWRLLFLPLAIVQVSLFSLGVSLWMAASTARYRDLVHLNQFIVQLWMFASAVIYPLSHLAGKYEWLVYLNPMASIVEAFRYTLLGQGWLPLPIIVCSAALSLLVAFSGVVFFQQMERAAVDNS